MEYFSSVSRKPKIVLRLQRHGRAVRRAGGGGSRGFRAQAGTSPVSRRSAVWAAPGRPRPTTRRGRCRQRAEKGTRRSCRSHYSVVFRPSSVATSLKCDAVDDDVSCCFREEEDEVSWATWRAGGVEAVAGDGLDRRQARRGGGPGRGAGRQRGPAARRTRGFVSGRDAAASLALNAATWCGAARVATAP